MKLSKNSNWIFFYQYANFDSYTLPTNICSLFWKSILGFLLFIISIPGSLLAAALALYNKFDVKNDIIEAPLTLTFSLLLYVITFIGWFLYTMIFTDVDTYVFKFIHLLYGFIIGVLLVGIVSGFVLLGNYVNTKLTSRNKKPKKESVIKAKFKAFKDKNCPLIEYID